MHVKKAKFGLDPAFEAHSNNGRNEAYPGQPEEDGGLASNQTDAVYFDRPVFLVFLRECPCVPTQIDNLLAVHRDDSVIRIERHFWHYTTQCFLPIGDYISTDALSGQARYTM